MQAPPGQTPEPLGWRRIYGVMTPSTATTVQPEYDDMRPPRSDADFNEVIRRIDAALESAVERIMTCRPQHLVLGMSAESIWKGGSAAGRTVAERIRRQAGDIPVTQATDALPAALSAMGVRARIALLTPYYPVARQHREQPMLKVAAEAERWHDKPVLAINAVTYWHELRTGGIPDRVAGCGRLLWEH